MRTRRERGVASLEFMVLGPFVMLVGFMVWQLGVAGWSAVSANEAARAAARAASLGESPSSAARNALPAGLQDDFQVSGGRVGDGYRYTVRIDPPAFTIKLPSVSRTVVMPAPL